MNWVTSEGVFPERCNSGYKGTERGKNLVWSRNMPSAHPEATRSSLGLHSTGHPWLPIRLAYTSLLITKCDKHTRQTFGSTLVAASYAQRPHLPSSFVTLGLCSSVTALIPNPCPSSSWHLYPLELARLSHHLAPLSSLQWPYFSSTMPPVYHLP